MAKLYRVLKLSYNTTISEMDVFTKDEEVNRLEFASQRRTLDGTLYRQRFAASEKKDFIYSFEYCNQDVFDFFNNAYEALLAGYEVTCERENDDGTFSSFQCEISLPQWQDETVSDTLKIYVAFTVELSEV